MIRSNWFIEKIHF